jgi:hypothetical protein
MFYIKFWQDMVVLQNVIGFSRTSQLGNWIYINFNFIYLIPIIPEIQTSKNYGSPMIIICALKLINISKMKKCCFAYFSISLLCHKYLIYYYSKVLIY